MGMEMLSCKDIAKKTMAREKPQGLWQNIDFKFHLFICKTCRIFIRQMENLDQCFSERVEKQAQDQGKESLRKEIIQKFTSGESE